ncbi:MAG: hypothetical protein FD163_1655 [Hyphomonadaceae bacterium]|nr:MAG: hypothetical protein FD163_1655 [Hyphomonadaceae bacterium]
MKYKDLLIVSKVLLWAGFAIILVSLLEGLSYVVQYNTNSVLMVENIPQTITGLITNMAYGVGFLGSVAVIEILLKILAALEATKE